MMVLEKGGKGWRPEILPPSSEAEDLEMIASRLQVDPKDIDHVWENKLGRLVGKDGTLNTVNKRRLYHWAVWQYKSLMRYSWLSLLLWSITIYFIFTIIVAAILYWSNEESKSGIRSLIQNDTIFLERKQIEEQHINWSEVDSPYSAFLLAIEMIMTIGYGTRGPNSSSAVASNLTMLINVISLTINSIFSGLFLAWVMRSQAAKIKFSSVAVITKREGCLALMVRLADPVASGLAMLEVSGFCVLVKRDPSCQDESSRWVELRHMGDMTFTAFSKGSQSILPLMWPTVVVHWINASSPLFTFSPEVLQTHSLEIIINVSGIREATGSRILCKTSYISEEIIWGARFSQSAVLYRKGNVNIGSFGLGDINKVILERNLPRHSAESIARTESESQTNNNTSGGEEVSESDSLWQLKWINGSAH